jgi:hypothetical protein
MMLVFECSMCQASYGVAVELAGQAIRCRECGEWGRVPRAAPAPSPPQAPPAPVRPQPARTAKREPWFYDLTEGYAYVNLAFGVVGGVILFVAAAAAKCLHTVTAVSYAALGVG